MINLKLTTCPHSNHERLVCLCSSVCKLRERVWALSIVQFLITMMFSATGFYHGDRLLNADWTHLKSPSPAASRSVGLRAQHTNKTLQMRRTLILSMFNENKNTLTQTGLAGISIISCDPLHLNNTNNHNLFAACPRPPPSVICKHQRLIWIQIMWVWESLNPWAQSDTAAAADIYIAACLITWFSYCPGDVFLWEIRTPCL